VEPIAGWGPVCCVIRSFGFLPLGRACRVSESSGRTSSPDYGPATGASPEGHGHGVAAAGTGALLTALSQGVA
jgi:hypothetical protein